VGDGLLRRPPPRRTARTALDRRRPRRRRDRRGALLGRDLDAYLSEDPLGAVV